MTIEFVYHDMVGGEDRPDLLPSDPDLSALNEETENRLPRLQATFGAASMTVRLLSYRYQRAWSGAVLSLRDEKGTLCVTWRDHTSRVMFEGVIMGAWQSQGEHMGEHTLAKPHSPDIPQKRSIRP